MLTYSQVVVQNTVPVEKSVTYWMTKMAARPMELARAMMSQLTQRRWLLNRIEVLTRNEFEKKNRNRAGT